MVFFKSGLRRGENPSFDSFDGFSLTPKVFVVLNDAGAEGLALCAAYLFQPLGVPEQPQHPAEAHGYDFASGLEA